MVYDVCFITDFWDAERCLTHDSLCEFFKDPKFSKEFYDNVQILSLRYWVVPRSRRGTLADSILVPVYYFYKLLVFRAKEAESRFTATYNYALAADLVGIPHRRRRVRELLSDPNRLCELYRLRHDPDYLGVRGSSGDVV